MLSPFSLLSPAQKPPIRFFLGSRSGRYGAIAFRPLLTFDNP